MEKFKVYQLQRVNRNYNGNKRSYDVKLNVIAEYEEKVFQNDILMLCEEIWNACNVDCWDTSWNIDNPEHMILQENTITYYNPEVFEGFCNSDILVETREGIYKAESAGWKKINSIDEGIYRIIYTYDFIQWNEIRNKSDFDENKLKEIRNIINNERVNK